MKIVKYGVEYRLLDNNGHILIKKNNIVDFNLSILCNFNINDIVNYEEFYQYYKSTQVVSYRHVKPINLYTIIYII